MPRTPFNRDVSAPFEDSSASLGEDFVGIIDGRDRRYWRHRLHSTVILVAFFAISLSAFLMPGISSLQSHPRSLPLAKIIQREIPIHVVEAIDLDRGYLRFILVHRRNFDKNIKIPLFSVPTIHLVRTTVPRDGEK